MRLSDLKPNSYEVEQAATPKLSTLHAGSYVVEPPAAAPAPIPEAPPESWGRSLVRGGLESLPAAGMVTGGVLGAVPTIEAGGVGGIPAAALGYAGGKQLERLGKQYLLGEKEDTVPTELPAQAKQLAGDLAEGSAVEMGGQAAGKMLDMGVQSAADSDVAKYIGNRVKQGAENFATTPAFDKISNATNVVGKGKNIVGKILESAKDEIPDFLKPVADLATGGAGRAAVYKTPLAPVQAVSDLAKGVGFAQEGMAKFLDSSSQAIQTLSSSNLFSDSQLSRIAASPFFRALEKAGKSGGSDAVATTHYVLQQTDPAYQKLLKDEQGGDNGVQK